jgi:hypothetical protein
MSKWEGRMLPEHHIEYAFSCDGIDYFNFTDVFNIPCERAMDALHIYREFKNRTDDIFLKAHVTAKKNLYAKNPINVFEIKKLDDQLEERLTMALPPPRIIANLASVYYFDGTENPYKYDRGYAEKKIEKWQTGRITVDEEDVGYDFFLLKPIQSLLPSLDLSDSDLQNYLTIAEMIDTTHLDTIMGFLSSNQRNSPLFKQLFSTNTGAKTSVLV